jgi:hypothetical protein
MDKTKQVRKEKKFLEEMNTKYEEETIILIAMEYEEKVTLKEQAEELIRHDTSDSAGQF